jgi:hypothetical protein
MVLTKINMTVGPVADFYFAQKYAFSTGLWYTVKGVSYNIYNSFYDTDVFVQKPLTKDEIKANAAEFNLQYLQIPVSLKIFSDQVTPGMPFYISLEEPWTLILPKSLSITPKML